VALFALLLFLLFLPLIGAPSQSALPATTYAATPTNNPRSCARPIDAPMITITMAPMKAIDPSATEMVRHAVEARVLALVDGECYVAISGSGTISVDLSPASTADLGNANDLTPPELATLLSEVGFVEFIDPQGRELEPGTVVATTISAPVSGTRIGGAPVFETLASNSDVRDAYVTRDESGANALAIEWDDRAAERLSTYSQTHVDDPLTVVIDHEVYINPAISAPFQKYSLLQGLSAQQMGLLTLFLRSESLPVPLKVLEVASSG
jgi:hypothetical protein